MDTQGVYKRDLFDAEHGEHAEHVKITPKQRAFARLLFEGMNQSDAYLKIAPKAANWQKSTVWEAASRMRHRPGVEVALRQLAALLRKEAIWTRADSIRALREIVFSNRGDAAIVPAVRELNLMHGYNDPIRHELEVIGSITRRIIDVEGVEVDQGGNAESDD